MKKKTGLALAMLLAVLGGTASAGERVLGSINSWQLVVARGDQDGTFLYCAGQRDIAGKPFMKIMLGAGALLIGVAHPAKLPVPSQGVDVKLDFERGGSFDLKASVTAPGLLMVPFEFTEDFIRNLGTSRTMTVRAKDVAKDYVLDGGPGLVKATIDCFLDGMEAELGSQ